MSGSTLVSHSCHTRVTLVIINCTSRISVFYSGHDQGTLEKLYDTLPSSLKEQNILVRAKQEEPEVQQARAEIIKQKTVNELSQINNLEEIPLPRPIENLLGML